jgi:hypothetical protein
VNQHPPADCPLDARYNLVVDGNTYSVNFGLYKSSKISTHDLHHANNVTFNYKYDLVAIRLFTAPKDFGKTTKKI